MGSYKKKLFIVLLLFLLISSFVCSSVNASAVDTYYTVDVYTILSNQQEALARLGVSYIERYGSDTIKSSFNSWLNNINFYTLWKYYYSGSSLYITCYFIPINVNWSTKSDYLMDLEDAYYEDVYNIYPVSGYQISASNLNGSNNYKRFVIPMYSNSASEGTYTSALFIPSLLIDYKNSVVENYRNGIMPTTSPWSMLFSAINENTDAVEDTTQAVNNLRNDFNAEESDEDYDFPTDNPTTDPTSSGIDNIFNMFYMRINSWNALGINVPIPFTGKSFTINPDITENIINGWTPSTQIATVFKTLLSGVWYYLLGRYIVKDVQHYVDGLQTGDILTKSDTNIKTEML